MAIQTEKLSQNQEERFAKQTLKNSPLRDLISKFNDLGTTMDHLLYIKGVSLRHNMDVYFIFDEYDYFVSFTQFDRLPINTYQNEQIISDLLTSFFKLSSYPEALLAYMNYIYKNYKNFHVYDSDFLNTKKKAFMYDHITKMTNKLSGYHMTKEHNTIFKVLLREFRGHQDDMFIKA